MAKKTKTHLARIAAQAETARLRCLALATEHEALRAEIAPVCPYAERGLECRNARPGEACGCNRQRPSAALDDVLRQAVEGFDSLHSNLRCYPDEFTFVRICNSIARHRNSIAAELGLPPVAPIAEVAHGPGIDPADLRSVVGLLAAAERCLRDDKPLAVRVALNEAIDSLLVVLGPAATEANLPHEAIEEDEQPGYCRCGEPLTHAVHSYAGRVEAQGARIDAHLNALARKRRKKS